MSRAAIVAPCSSILNSATDQSSGQCSTESASLHKGGQLPAAQHTAQGRTYFQAPKIDAITIVESREKLTPGELVRCTIIASEGYDLIARPTSELETKVSLPLI